jgi:hypothetical protein
MEEGRLRRISDHSWQGWLHGCGVSHSGTRFGWRESGLRSTATRDCGRRRRSDPAQLRNPVGTLPTHSRAGSFPLPTIASSTDCNTEAICLLFAAARAATAAAYTDRGSACACAALSADREPLLWYHYFTPRIPPACGWAGLPSHFPPPVRSGALAGWASGAANVGVAKRSIGLRHVRHVDDRHRTSLAPPRCNSTSQVVVGSIASVMRVVSRRF